MKRIFYFAVTIALLSACKGNHSETTGTPAKADSAEVKTAVKYTCPMHPEVISKEPGKCPQCGMDLEAKS